jgi:hypothetical protein
VRTGNWFRFESDREMLLSKLTPTKKHSFATFLFKVGEEDMLPSPAPTPLLIVAIIPTH